MTDELEEADYRIQNIYDEVSGPPFAPSWTALEELLSTIDKMTLSYAKGSIPGMYFHLGEATALAERVRRDLRASRSREG